MGRANTLHGVRQMRFEGLLEQQAGQLMRYKHRSTWRVSNTSRPPRRMPWPKLRQPAKAVHPAIQNRVIFPPAFPFQYFGRCDTTHRRACSIGPRGGCAARKRFIVGKLSIRSRQAQTAGSFAYIACASGAKPRAWMIGSMKKSARLSCGPSRNCPLCDSSRSST